MTNVNIASCILDETSQWLVLNKPTGLSVHNDAINVLSLLQRRQPRGEFFPVHRLDQETSGVLLVAKSAEAASALGDSLAAATSHKIYAAILRGVLSGGPKIEWTWQLSDKAEGRKNPQGLSRDRKDCTTLITVEGANQYVTLVHCAILTGRQHQIRKHAAIAKHPILGDRRYNDPKYNARIADLYSTNRMFLHAQELKIRWQGRELEFKAPLPPEFKKVSHTF